MTSAASPEATDLAPTKAAQPPPSSTSFYAAAHAASAARAEAAEAAVSAEAASIAARLAGGKEGGGGQRHRPPRCWPRSALRRIDAEARRRGRRCVMWDDSGAEGFCCWVRWDWGKGQPLTKNEGDDDEKRDSGAAVAAAAAVTDASHWESLCRSLGPPLTPEREIPASEVGEWLDRHTMKVHGWGDVEEEEEKESLGDDSEGEGGRREKENERRRR